MKQFRTVSEIDVQCTPKVLYDFVTTPKNWVGTHPATKAVRGDAESPKSLGDRWFELVEPPGGRRFEAEWTVVKADPPRQWEIQAKQLGDLPIDCTIIYNIENSNRDESDADSANNYSTSHFERLMVFSLPDEFPVSDDMKKSLTSTEGHEMYLRAIKDRIESWRTSNPDRS